MPTVSRKALSAVEAVVYIACKPGTSPVCSKEVSEYQGVAERYLEPIMQRLVHEKILRGVRGPRGGYLLAKERRKICLSHIVSIVESMEQHQTKRVSPLQAKVVAPVWHVANRLAVESLKGQTIQDLCDAAKEQGLLSDEDKPNFDI